MQSLQVVVHLKTNLKAEVSRIQISRMAKGPAIWIANMKSSNSPGFDSQLANLGMWKKKI